MRFFIYSIGVTIATSLFSAGYTVQVTNAFIEKAGKIFEQTNLQQKLPIGVSSLFAVAEKRMRHESAVASIAATLLEKNMVKTTDTRDHCAPKLSPVSSRWKNLLPDFEEEQIKQIARMLRAHGSAKKSEKIVSQIYARCWIMLLSRSNRKKIAQELTTLIATEMVKSN